MTYKKIWMVLLLLGCCVAVQAQTAPKQMIAVKTDALFKIDGNLLEPAWKLSNVAANFIELRPNTFAPEADANRTEICVVYNDQGIYIGGYCHEKNKDSIATELVGRDNFGNNDVVGVIFDTYYDKINGFEYFVTPLGEQMDAKLSPNTDGNSEDFAWNSVWQSASKLQHDGWSFEMFLPYSALRFGKKDQQLWGMNILRKRNKIGQQLFWNPIDPQKNGFLAQEGTLLIPDKIAPPLRLSFSPYFSSYANNYPQNKAGVKNTSYLVNGGMDVKYGINESFTLDATLVPDFGQTQSDNSVLNLSPFEVKVDENRTFFTEGTELFNKGNLFYSRRIGAAPIHRYEVGGLLNANEQIVNNPTETKLLNATKISGRTNSKLGIGIFNAVAQTMYATVEDDKGNRRKIETSPLTNYNIFVLDQSLKNNSSLSFVNTSVLRSGKDADANVTAVLFDFYDKKNKWNIFGNAYTSLLSGAEKTTGFKYRGGIGKVSGALTFSGSVEVLDDKFSQDDLGLQFYNNTITSNFYIGHSITTPKKWMNRLFNNLNLSYQQRYAPRAFQKVEMNYNAYLQLKNLWWLSVVMNAAPQAQDFFEPRIAGRKFNSPAYLGGGVGIESNSAKKYSASLYLFYNKAYLFNSVSWSADIGQTMRFNNKFSVEHYLSLNPVSNNAGFPNSNSNNGNDGIFNNNTLLFGRRHRMTVENRLKFKYSFNNTMFVTLRVRHYLGSVRYHEFYTLNEQGSLDRIPAGSTAIEQYISNNHQFNNNYNSFNVDMVYSWRFAPGSEFNIVWKKAGNNFEQEVIDNYFANFNHTIAAPQSNSLSLKILYYLDYLQLKKKRA